jgi:hypothetical protein
MLISLLYDHGMLVTGALVVAAFIGTGLFGQRIILRFVPLDRRRAHNDVLGAASAIAGVINAVLLAFIVFAAWTDYDRARDVVSQEGSLVADLNADAAVLPGGLGTHVQEELHNYVNVVVDSEWPAMADGRMSSRDSTRRAGWQYLRHTYADLLELDASKGTPGLVVGEMLKRLNSLYDARRQRLAHASGGSLSKVVWIVVIAVGFLSMAFCWLLGFEEGGLHKASTTIIAASLGLVVFLILALDRPFRGPDQISVQPLSSVQRMMNTQAARAAAAQSAAKP